MCNCLLCNPVSLTHLSPQGVEGQPVAASGEPDITNESAQFFGLLCLIDLASTDRDRELIELAFQFGESAGAVEAIRKLQARG